MGEQRPFSEGRCKTICRVTYSVISTNSPPPTDKSFAYTVESVAPCLFASHKNQATQMQRYLSKRVYRFSLGSTVVLNFMATKAHITLLLMSTEQSSCPVLELSEIKFHLSAARGVAAGSFVGEPK